jgi:tetratricopeptide (TPR) repeat protein
VIEARGKNERNRRIFELAVADDPADLYLRYKLADFLRRFDDAKARVRDVLESVVSELRNLDRAAVADLPFAGEVFAFLAQFYRDGGDPARGLECAEEGLRLTDPTVNLRFLHASISLELGDATTAAREFRDCLSKAGEVLVMPGQCGVTGILSEIGLAHAFHQLQRWDEARQMVEQAADREPGRDDLLELWLACARRTADPAAAVRWIARRLESRSTDAASWMAGAEILYGIRMFGQARAWFARAAGLAPDPAPAFAWCAECFLHEQKLEAALDLASQARTEPRAQAVIAAISLAAEIEVPELVRCADSDVRAAFRLLLENLRQTEGAPIARKIESVCGNLTIFDPAGIALAASALE